MSTEQKRKELEAAGYDIFHGVDGDNSPYEYWRITTPDGWEYETEWLDHPGSWLKFKPSPDLEKEAIDKAYEHMQREQELVALRKRMHEIEMYTLHCMNTNHSWVAQASNDIWAMARDARVGDLDTEFSDWVLKAQELVDNITADDESDSE